MFARKMTSTIGALALDTALFAAGALQPAAAQSPSRSLCVYDPIGANGFIYQSFQDYVVPARSWGIARYAHLYPRSRGRQ